MANFAQRSGTESQGRSAGRRPIVLARIPRVGAEAAPPGMTIPMPQQPPVPMPQQPPVAEIPQPESMPRLDLHTEIQQQLRLHAPHSPEPGPMHAREQETQPKPAPQRERRRSSRSRAQHHESNAPTGFGQLMYGIHSQLAPHAGLIVAMALIASAGLLYWLIVGPAHIPALDTPQYGQEIGLEGFGASSSQMPDFVHQPTPNRETDTWAEVPLPNPQQISPQQVSPEEPQVEMPVAEQLPAAGGLQFPTTSHPEDLNFSQMRPVLPAAEQPESLPEVARRPEASANR